MSKREMTVEYLKEMVKKSFASVDIDDGKMCVLPFQSLVDTIELYEDKIAWQEVEIQQLAEKVENQKSVIKGQNKAIEKEKAEIKRLYDEYIRVNDFCAQKGCICCVCENKKTCNECSTCGNLATEKCKSFKIDTIKYARAVERVAKLQKQVDELINESEAYDLGYALGLKHGVKDTARDFLFGVESELAYYGDNDTFSKAWILDVMMEIGKRRGVLDENGKLKQ